MHLNKLRYKFKIILIINVTLHRQCKDLCINGHLTPGKHTYENFHTRIRRDQVIVSVIHVGCYGYKIMLDVV